MAPIRAKSPTSAITKTIMRILGIIVLCIALLTLVLPYVTFTKKEKVLDIGPVEAVAETRE
jgi:L-asparagine transporter-like permease